MLIRLQLDAQVSLSTSTLSNVHDYWQRSHSWKDEDLQSGGALALRRRRRRRSMQRSVRMLPTVWAEVWICSQMVLEVEMLEVEVPGCCGCSVVARPVG